MSGCSPWVTWGQWHALSPSRQHGTSDMPGRPKQCAYGAVMWHYHTVVVIEVCSGGEGVVEQQLPEVVVVGEGGDMAGRDEGGRWERKHLFVDTMFVMWQMPTNITGLTRSNSEGMPLPSVTGKGLCGVRHSIPWPLPSKPLPVYLHGFPNPCSSLLEAEEIAQDGSHPQQGQCLARSPTLCLERELVDEQGNKGLSALDGEKDIWWASRKLSLNVQGWCKALYFVH